MRVHEFRCDRRALHLVDEVAHLLQACEVRAFRVQCTLLVSAFRKRSDNELRHSTRMDLEVQVSGDWILPELK